jgi:hypothetical protein
VFTSLQDCDDSGYITVDNLAIILGPDVPKRHLASIIDEADIVRDKRILYEELLALWDKREDVQRTQMLENVKSRRLLGHAASARSAVSSVLSSFISDQD